MGGESSELTHRKMLEGKRVTNDFPLHLVGFPNHSVLCMDYAYKEDKWS